MAAGESYNPGVVVVAAGRGERAGAPEEGPKQYRLIGGMPVIAHTLREFAAWGGATAGIVVVIHPDDEALFADALSRVPSRAQLPTAP